MRIAVVGTGYVGLVTGTCLAETGNYVTCIDVDKDKVAKLKKKMLTIYEPGLNLLFERNMQQGRLHFTTDLSQGIKKAEIIFLALPTPAGEEGAADLSHVLKVADQMGAMLEDYTLIVDKSTVPVGTAAQVRTAIARTARVDFDVVSNPEFLREGVAVEDFMKPERIVIGTSSQRAAHLMKQLYAPLVRQGNPILVMDERSAELTKYAANAFLATKITFMNEIANLCERLGADVDRVREGIGSDSRIGKRFLFAGIGYGGSCFPKDVQALVRSAEEAHYDFEILKAVTAQNERQRQKLVERIKAHFGQSLRDKTFAVWGLSFKPYTDDIREAPALYNIQALLAAEARVKAYDPEAMNNVKKLLGGQIDYCANEYEAATDADALLIMTEWSVFRTPDFQKLKQKLARPIVFDGRNLYDPEIMAAQGFTYHSIGRKAVEQR